MNNGPLAVYTETVYLFTWPFVMELHGVTKMAENEKRQKSLK